MKRDKYPQQELGNHYMHKEDSKAVPYWLRIKNPEHQSTLQQLACWNQGFQLIELAGQEQLKSYRGEEYL